MAYRALYRQWRPATFSQVVGQKAVIETLRNQVVTNRIAHAYLFCGSRGTGKTSTAKILAKAINCENPQDGDPCGECPNCLRVDNEESLDIIEIDAASNNGVDEMRDLRDTVKYPPQYGQYKVYIIDEVHMLSTSAFNALLKTLEEPPAHIVFILATTEPQKLPATILSRCQRFDFGRISAAQIQGRLREAVAGAGSEATDGALMQIARAAEGGMRDALSILDMCLGYGKPVTEELVRSVLGTSDRSFLFRFADAIAREDAAEVFRLIDRLMRDGREPSTFAREFSSHIRMLLTVKCCGKEAAGITELTEEDLQEYFRQSEAFTVTRLMAALDLFLALETGMRYSASPRLALENTSLKCCLRTGETDARALSDRIEELEKKMEELVRHGVPAAEPKPAGASGKASAGKAAQEKKAQAEPQAGQAAGKAAAGGPDSVWKEALQQIKKKEPAVFGMLSQGDFTVKQGNEFVWRSREIGSFFTIALNQPDRRKKVADILTEIAGEACTFRATDPDTRGKEEDGLAEQRYLDPLIDTFGKGAVDVVENLE